MAHLATHNTTAILHELSDGDPSAVHRLLPRVYEELRTIAARALRGERADHTLQPTALVHEAFLRLVNREGITCPDRAHFLALAAATCRRVLVDHARRHRASKRGGQRKRVSLHDEAAIQRDEREVDLLAVDDALKRLARLHPRQARTVELRFFGGLSVTEMARVLSVSPRTVKNDWRVARAWLRRELSHEGAP